jgi:hypothetical protein
LVVIIQLCDALYFKTVQCKSPLQGTAATEELASANRPCLLSLHIPYSSIPTSKIGHGLLKGVILPATVNSTLLKEFNAAPTMHLTVHFIAAVSSSLFLLLLPFRLWKLRKETVKTAPEHRHHVKGVCEESVMI